MMQLSGGCQEIAKAQPGMRRPTLGGAISDSVSTLIIRGSISADLAERESAARSILSLGGSVSARIALRNGLGKACDESIDVRPLASALASSSRGSEPPSALFWACMDCVRTGDRSLSEAGAELGAALARPLDDRSAVRAVEDCLRAVGSPDIQVRRGAAKLLLALARHPATDTSSMAERALDSGSVEASEFARKAAALPPKIIDVEAA